MNYMVDYIREKNIVYIQVKGRLNFQIAEQYSKEAIKLAHENDCSKFLFNYTETESQGKSTNLHATGYEFEQFGFKNTDRVAVVLGKVKKGIDAGNQNSNWCELKFFFEDNNKVGFDWLLDK